MKTTSPEAIVCLAFPAWDGDYLKSTVQLMRLIARSRPVLYVDYAYTWKDFLKSVFGQSHAPWRRMVGLQSPLRTIPVERSLPGGSLHVVSLPPVVPSNFLKNPRLYRWLSRLNAFFLRHRIRSAMQQLGIANPTVVNAFNPAFGLQLADKLGERQLIYYCYDEIGAAGWAKAHGARLEEAFINRCDAVVVTSIGLLQRKSRLHPRCVLVKNGVDFDLFSRTFSPENLPQIPGRVPAQPVIGYLGSVDERVDFQLVEDLAHRLPRALFVFVGRVPDAAAAATLRTMPNVIFLGSKPPETLPAWVQTFDVCLIPFVKNDLTAGIYPLKINEYLAAGKPVIATPFADLSDFENIIAIADDAPGFVAAIEKSLTEDAPRERARRVHFAQQNSWEARAAEFEQVCFGQTHTASPATETALA